MHLSKCRLTRVTESLKLKTQSYENTTHHRNNCASSHLKCTSHSVTKYLKEQHVLYLKERDPKRDPGDDSQVGLHHIGHQSEAALRSRETQRLQSDPEASYKHSWRAD